MSCAKKPEICSIFAGVTMMPPLFGFRAAIEERVNREDQRRQQKKMNQRFAHQPAHPSPGTFSVGGVPDRRRVGTLLGGHRHVVVIFTLKRSAS